VLPVGGIKEKVLAARRAGLKRVVLSRENAKDLRDLPEEVRAELEFVLVEKLSEVLDVVFDAEGAARWKRVG
jgi:ATP-dependent Lon protease